MKQMKKVLALTLALVLLLTFTACGKKENKTDSSKKTTAATKAPTTTTTTLPSDGDELLPDDERDGSKELPFEIGSALEFDAVVKAGGVTYYDVFRVDGTILTLESADATIEYEGKVYEPVDGVISFPVSTDDILNPVKLAIANKGATDATFHVTFAYPKGTLLNPYELTIGEVVTTIEEGNEQGVVYTYVATADGVLAIHDKSITKGQSYDIEVYNLASGANRTLNEDGVDNIVSVSVTKGDEVRVTYLVLPDDQNAYPSVTLKSTVGFTAGKVEEDTKKEITYTVTVKDQDGKAMSGVKLAFVAGGKTVSATTDAKGVARAASAEEKMAVTITLPAGYIADKFTYNLTSAAPSQTITLTKEQITPPTTPTTKPTDPSNPTQPTQPEVTTMDYTVTLLDGKGKPVGGLNVVFYSGDKQVAKQTGNKQGVSKVTLERGTYTIKVEGTKLNYDPKAAVVSANSPSLTLILAAAIDTSKSYKLDVTLPDETEKRYTAYYLSEGAAYVTLTPGDRTYFMFEPTRDGTYRFASSNTYAKIGHFGTDMFVYQTNSAEVSGNAFTLSVRESELGNVYVIGIDASTNCSAAMLQVTRVGDPAWSIEDEPLVEYTGSGAPAQITAPSGLVDVDIKSATEHHLVFNEKDGYYHLDSANGPVVYVNLDSSYASIVGMLTEFGNMTAYIYNADGTFKAKEQYATLMQEYVNKMDKRQRVYPLTKDLEYMIRNFGNSQNWWNEGEAGYLFEEVSGVNPANAWMFLFCYAA